MPAPLTTGLSYEPSRREMVAAIVQEFKSRGLVNTGDRFSDGYGVGLLLPGTNRYHDVPACVFSPCTDEQIAEIYREYVH